MHTHRHLHILTAALMLALAGCASTSTAPTAKPAATSPMKPMTGPSTAQRAVANLASASGSLVSGRLTLVPRGDGVDVSGEIGGFNPGSSHGFHIHEKGDCSAADASSAGGHFNPAGQPHGRAMQGTHHAGDSDNLVADANGVAKINTHFMGVSLGGGAGNDIASRAIVVHAAPDDYTSQPAGNAGARVACGVIKVVR
ncbi:superoxide dismutase family protein [Thermomonas sp.]|uniref:superoxide dismutase family protein n=1 Tax=Thermomonas sp. TaxID=1971895 RepID=UPI0031F3325F